MYPFVCHLLLKSIILFRINSETGDVSRLHFILCDLPFVFLLWVFLWWWWWWIILPYFRLGYTIYQVCYSMWPPPGLSLAGAHDADKNIWSLRVPAGAACDTRTVRLLLSANVGGEMKSEEFHNASYVHWLQGSSKDPFPPTGYRAEQASMTLRQTHYRKDELGWRQLTVWLAEEPQRRDSPVWPVWDLPIDA